MKAEGQIHRGDARTQICSLDLFFCLNLVLCKFLLVSFCGSAQVLTALNVSAHTTCHNLGKTYKEADSANITLEI